MLRSILSTPTIALALIGALVFTTGCDSATVSPDAQRETLEKGSAATLAMGPSEMRKGLATLRRATARYHRVEAAIDDGFAQAEPCTDPPGPGAIGIPYVKPDRLDANIDLEKPEVLFYEPQKNGKLRLVGAEPVVPIADWPEEEPPSLFGQEFHRNDEAGLFGLHMWVWRHNPDGVFAFTHPKVSCEFAE